MKKIVFLTGTRADFGKLKSLISITSKSFEFDIHIFVTGMHLQKKYGYTVSEIEKSNFKNIFKFSNFTSETSMDITLSKTIEGFSNFVKVIEPDLIVIHGDRIEALAGAIVGSLNNILVAHIEGGEVSGTIDELIRHSVSKLSHIHFVSNEIAKNRLIQMGEIEKNIFVIGSPDVDIMLSDNLPSISAVFERYDINFEKYAVVLFHPVTTEIELMGCYVKQFVDALLENDLNYIVIFPNNDLGSNVILKEYDRLKNKKNFLIFPSIRFEYFLVLLKNSQLIIGNSSAGIREAPYYGLPTLNIGTRQQNRALNKNIINTNYEKSEISNGIKEALDLKIDKVIQYGSGDSDLHFLSILSDNKFWYINKQKIFKDLD
uniref:UDP-N-acetylglucosamine 2-epimerase n=1 Tax=Algoriphagus sp. TaxID=1872435 RepID=UPI004047767D